MNYRFLQMFIWGRFEALTAKVVSVTGVRNVYRASGLWWAGMEQSNGKSLRSIDNENFNFGPYTSVLTRIQIIEEVISEAILVPP